MKIPAALKSRKFWIATAAFLAALSGFITAIVQGDLNQAQSFLQAMLVAAGLYVGAEGAADVVARYQAGKKEVLESAYVLENPDEVDRETVVSGKTQ